MIITCEGLVSLQNCCRCANHAEDVKFAAGISIRHSPIAPLGLLDHTERRALHMSMPEAQE